MECLFSECAAGYEGVGSPGVGCTQCPAGTFKPAAGNAACTPCAAGQTSTADFTDCEGCVADQYSANGAPCADCNTPSETTTGAVAQSECRK